MKIIPPKNHFFAYNPHYWFLYARKESEKKFLQSVKESSRQFLMTVSGKNYLDKKVNEIINPKYFQYNILGRKLFDKNNYYLNVIGDYIIEVFLDEKVSKQIDTLFKNTKNSKCTCSPLGTRSSKSFGRRTSEDCSCEKHITQTLQEIISQTGKNKLIISRNTKRAQKLRQKFKRYFYLP